MLDVFGNVQGTMIDSATSGQTVTYEDWGAPSITGDTTNRLTWKGLPYDPVLGLIQMRARWYDPGMGRFISEDPIGLAGGINPYVFANDDPINGFDPSGMTAYISFDNNRCQYSYTRFDPDLYFELGGCDFGGGSGLVTGFDPLATDRSWRHPDQPSQGDGPSGPAASSTSGRPTPQQVFAAVGKELTPFNNAMNCVEASGALAVTGALDLVGAGDIYHAVRGTAAIAGTISAVSIETASEGITVAEVRTHTTRIAADATELRNIDLGMAQGALFSGGYNVATRDKAPLWSYLPIGGSVYAGKTAYNTCKSKN
jgi:RHS repeat-associated protein